MDKLSADRRSANMSRIRSGRTAPELLVRRTAHRLGYRFRLHRKDLTGKPDLVFPSRRKLVWVHGCFWHQHPGCREGRLPGSNADYWKPKLERNVVRDEFARRKLADEGWESLVLWECELTDASILAARLRAFLN